MADQKWLVGEGGFVMPLPDSMINGFKAMESRLFWGPPPPSKPAIYFCYINVPDITYKVLALHEKRTDKMYKVGESYQQLDEVWPKDSYTFDHYATSMEI